MLAFIHSSSMGIAALHDLHVRIPLGRDANLKKFSLPHDVQCMHLSFLAVLSLISSYTAPDSSCMYSLYFRCKGVPFF